MGFNSMAFTTVQPIHTFSLNFKNIQNLEKSRHKISQKRNILSTKAMQTGAQNYDGVRIGPPPDLPSLLLHNRIVYLGIPLVPAVTELIVAEFLYLQYENSEKPVFMYLNSTGTSNPDGTSAGFETEAFAIADTMNYIKPPVHTICVGQAFGTCAMLLSSGEKKLSLCIAQCYYYGSSTNLQSKRTSFRYSNQSS